MATNVTVGKWLIHQDLQIELATATVKGGGRSTYMVNQMSKGIHER